MILDIVLAIAVLVAMAGAATRNLTAWVLLASFAFSTALCHFGASFNAVAWMLMDVAVICVILRPGMKRADWLILALFLPVWMLYFLWPWWGPQAISGIVALQMMLTFPFRWMRSIMHAWARFNRDFDPWGDLRVYA